MQRTPRHRQGRYCHRPYPNRVGDLPSRLGERRLGEKDRRAAPKHSFGQLRSGLPRSERSEWSVGGGTAEQQCQRVGIGGEQPRDGLTWLHVEIDEQVRSCDTLSDQFAASDGTRCTDDNGTFIALVDSADSVQPLHPNG
ncbi:hypothetical protein MINTM019_27650 [Mycobacterium paraintracellulare]|uniref:Uncharacterized protein n=1 Tax=Mycobacterium [tuberculosis] TKK-01-0051 TaxID=1324261 RepID=A0A051TVU5_9MYCO|nr:hypothetical protein K875_04005 [Mycobacterium [tuberculosis] TKK-01-0051]BCP05309.1 hypothetical protein MINTM019_27650 [Mycobacterium paraintracellulare]